MLKYLPLLAPLYLGENIVFEVPAEELADFLLKMTLLLLHPENSQVLDDECRKAEVFLSLKYSPEKKKKTDR